MVENLKCRKCIILNKEMVRLRKSHEQELRLMTTALTKKVRMKERMGSFLYVNLSVIP